MKAEDFPPGTVVELKSGGGRMTVLGSKRRLVECAGWGSDADQPFTTTFPPDALRLASDDPESSARARNKAAVETLREAFTLRAGCNRVDHAAEDAAAEYRTYRAQSVRLFHPDESNRSLAVLQAWRDTAASYPEAAARLAEGLRANGKDGDLRACAAALLEAFAQ
jgi:uncharacterized protein YodC (DUF2158 family)